MQWRCNAPIAALELSAVFKQMLLAYGSFAVKRGLLFRVLEERKEISWTVRQAHPDTFTLL